MTVSYRVNRVVYNIESVDSICRDTTYTQYKSQKRYTYKPLLTAYHSSSSVFMTNKTPRVAKTHRESTTPGTRKTGKLFFFLSFFFRQLSSTLPQSLTMVFAQNSSILQSSATTHRFFATSKSSPGGYSCPLSNYGFICHTIFTFVCMRIETIT